MRPTRVQVSYQKDMGFTLRVEEYSRVRSLVASLTDSFCMLTGHHFCNSFLVNGASTWDWRGSKDLVRVPIDRETANKLSKHDDPWGWLDNDEEA